MKLKSMIASLLTVTALSTVMITGVYAASGAVSVPAAPPPPTKIAAPTAGGAPLTAAALQGGKDSLLAPDARKAKIEAASKSIKEQIASLTSLLEMSGDVDEKSQLQTKLTALEAKDKQMDAALAKANQQLGDTTGKLDAANKDLATAKQDIAKSAETIAKLQARLAELDKQKEAAAGDTAKVQKIEKAQENVTKNLTVITQKAEDAVQKVEKAAESSGKPVDAATQAKLDAVKVKVEAVKSANAGGAHPGRPHGNREARGAQHKKMLEARLAKATDPKQKQKIQHQIDLLNMTPEQRRAAVKTDLEARVKAEETQLATLKKEPKNLNSPAVKQLETKIARTKTMLAKMSAAPDAAVAGGDHQAPAPDAHVKAHDANANAAGGDHQDPAPDAHANAHDAAGGHDGDAHANAHVKAHDANAAGGDHQDPAPDAHANAHAKAHDANAAGDNPEGGKDKKDGDVKAPDAAVVAPQGEHQGDAKAEVKADGAIPDAKNVKKDLKEATKALKADPANIELQEKVNTLTEQVAASKGGKDKKADANANAAGGDHQDPAPDAHANAHAKAHDANAAGDNPEGGKDKKDGDVKAPDAAVVAPQGEHQGDAKAEVKADGAIPDAKNVKKDLKEATKALKADPANIELQEKVNTLTEQVAASKGGKDKKADANANAAGGDHQAPDPDAHANAHAKAHDANAAGDNPEGGKDKKDGDVKAPDAAVVAPQGEHQGDAKAEVKADGAIPDAKNVKKDLKEATKALKADPANIELQEKVNTLTEQVAASKGGKDKKDGVKEAPAADDKKAEGAANAKAAPGELKNEKPEGGDAAAVHGPVHDIQPVVNVAVPSSGEVSVKDQCSNFQSLLGKDSGLNLGSVGNLAQDAAKVCDAKAFNSVISEIKSRAEEAKKAEEEAAAKKAAVEKEAADKAAAIKKKCDTDFNNLLSGGVLLGYSQLKGIMNDKDCEDHKTQMLSALKEKIKADLLSGQAFPVAIAEALAIAQELAAQSGGKKELKNNNGMVSLEDKKEEVKAAPAVKVIDPFAR